MCHTKQMRVIRHKLFSEKKEEDSTGKKVAKGVANVGAGLGIGYVALKHEKKHLEKKIRNQEEIINRSIEASDKYAKKNLEGAKNKIKNFINPRRKAVIEAREDDLWLRGAGKAMKEVSDAKTKLKRVDAILDAPKKAAEAIKGGAKKVGEEVAHHATKFKSKQRSAAFMKKGKPFRRIIYK